MDINQIIGYVLSLILISLTGFIIKEIALLKDSEFVKNFKEKAIGVLGNDNEGKLEKIVKDACIEVEQLAKEGLVENISGSKHNKALELIESALAKAGLKVTDEEIYNLIKVTIGYMNQGK
ncbi:hypothetical protein IAI10_24445 [Clostridium sp. 19966]|uniref:hypothetical protein n=1 Tax=Clostridium sp. 19966 TaxID=2768166 RepID=UPI0028DF0ED1|nr:hypothetical protein [Clostridium sp. 19966]MDT8719774.1 hypothetical protein [Clostridium sp. 19966]